MSMNVYKTTRVENISDVVHFALNSSANSIEPVYYCGTHHNTRFSRVVQFRKVKGKGKGPV